MISDNNMDEIKRQVDLLANLIKRCLLDYVETLENNELKKFLRSAIPEIVDKAIIVLLEKNFREIATIKDSTVDYWINELRIAISDQLEEKLLIVQNLDVRQRIVDEVLNVFDCLAVVLNSKDRNLFELLKNRFRESAGVLMNEGIDHVAKSIREKLPDSEDGNLAIDATTHIAKSTVNSLLNGEDGNLVFEHIIEEVKASGRMYIANKVNVYVEDAVDTTCDKILSQDKDQGQNSNLNAYKDVCKIQITDNVQQVLTGHKDVGDALIDSAKGVGAAYAKDEIRKQAIDGVNYIASSLKQKGKNSRKINKKIDNIAGIGGDKLANAAIENFAEVFDGNKNIGDACQDALINSAKDVGEAYAKDEIKNQAINGANYIASSLKQKGKNSRKINRQIDNIAGIGGEELASAAIENFADVLDGNKKVGEALVDTTKLTIKNTTSNYVKGYGAEIAAEGIKMIAKEAEKRIRHAATKTIVVGGLNKLANANTITAIAGIAIELGGSIKAFIDGEITKTELLRELGEKGTSICVSSAYGTLGAGIGTMLGGPLGAVVGASIGSMVGYVASSMLYGSVLKAFEDADLAKKEYQLAHEICEESIRVMREQRHQFEMAIETLIENRQMVFDKSFDMIDAALRNNDFAAFSNGLNHIAEEMGGKLQFRTFSEFDAFMSNKEEAFEL